MEWWSLAEISISFNYSGNYAIILMLGTDVSMVNESKTEKIEWSSHIEWPSLLVSRTNTRTLISRPMTNGSVFFF